MKECGDLKAQKAFIKSVYCDTECTICKFVAVFVPSFAGRVLLEV